MVEYYDVCVICALPEEANAFIQVIKSQGYQVEKNYSTQLQRDYFHATLQNNVKEQLQIMVTWLPNMGSMYTISDFSNILQNFQLRFAIMTGICAGDKEKVKLGDLIVAERTYISDDGSFVIDDNDKRKQEFDVKMISLSNDVLQFVRGFEDWKKEGFLLPRLPSKHQQRDWLLSTLLEKKSIRAIERKELDTHAPKWRELIKELQQAKVLRNDTSMELINIQQVEDLSYGIEEFPYIDPPTPTCYIAPMASSNAVHKDRPFPDISKPVRKVLGLDMESMAFYHTLQERNKIRSLVVKGVCDYADGDKDNSYHDYAATLSAIYAYTFIKHFVTNERVPWPEGKKPGQITTVISNPIQKVTPSTTQISSVEKTVNNNNTDKKPIKVFLASSQSPKDKGLIDELNKHFSFMTKHSKSIENWYGHNTYAGDVPTDEIEKHLREAQIIIILFTSDYIYSDFYDQETPLIEERYNNGVKVIPIILRPISVDWKDTFYGKLVSLPRNGPAAVTLWKNQDEVLTNIVDEIRSVVKSLS